MHWKWIALSALLLGTLSAYAERYYVGGGVSQIAIDHGHEAIGSQNATGYQLVTGVIWDHWGLDFSISGTTLDTGEVTDIYYPPDSADYGILDMGLRYYFRIVEDDQIIPWVGAGLGIHFISWDTYWYNVDGAGYSLAAGVDCRVVSNLYLRSGLKYHRFTSDDTYGYGPYDGTTIEANIGLIWLFGEGCMP